MPASRLRAGDLESETLRAAVLSLAHVNRTALAELELIWTLPDVLARLRRVQRRRWSTLRATMEQTRVRGSGGSGRGGGRLTVGELLQTWVPAPRWEDPTAVDLLLAWIAMVEHFEGEDTVWRGWRAWLDRELPPTPGRGLLTEPRAWCSSHRPFGHRGPGRPAVVSFWLATAEVARWIRLRHRDVDGRFDGAVSWRQVITILTALGWQVTYSPRELKRKLQQWRRTQSPPPPAVLPIEPRGRSRNGRPSHDHAPQGGQV